jgi:hypothetical protein
MPKDVGGSGASASRAPFASSDEDHVLDASRRPRMRRASNDRSWDAAPPSREAMGSSGKKPTFFEKTLMCMGLDIRKTQYDSYVAQRQINHNQQVLQTTMNRLLPENERPPAPS